MSSCSSVQLRKAVCEFMVHGPCGRLNPRSPCMDNFRCKKRFKRDFLERTVDSKDGYPLYRRRNHPSMTATIERGKSKKKYQVRILSLGLTSVMIRWYSLRGAGWRGGWKG